MPHRAPLSLRIGALASSLLLLTGFIAFRTGQLFPQKVVIQDPPTASLDFNSIGTEISNSNTHIGQAELANKDQPGLLDVKLNEVATVLSANGGYSLESRVNLVNFMKTSSGNSSIGAPKLTQNFVEELSRRPGKASPILVRHDALTLMSGSKSAAIFTAPTTPVDTQNAVDKYEALAAKSFSRRDLNGDGKLTEGELGDSNWKRFLEQGAVENDAVDSEGFLKNFYWYANQK